MINQYDAVATLAKRLRQELNLLSSLLETTNASGLETDWWLRTRLQAVILSIEALFVDPSLSRIDLGRHLAAVTAMAGRHRGYSPVWVGPTKRLMAAASQASYAGLVLADLIWVYKPSELNLTTTLGPAVIIRCRRSSVLEAVAESQALSTERLVRDQLVGSLSISPEFIELTFQLLPAPKAER